MQNRFAHLNVRLTRHFKAQAAVKGFDPRAIIDAWRNPDEVYPSGPRHPGQWRVVGNGLALVGRPDGDEFVLITVYLDGVITPVRPDQLLTPEGRRFAERGRGA
jgi:hypothetical protein